MDAASPALAVKPEIKTGKIPQEGKKLRKKQRIKGRDYPIGLPEAQEELRILPADLQCGIRRTLRYEPPPFRKEGGEILLLAFSGKLKEKIPGRKPPAEGKGFPEIFSGLFGKTQATYLILKKLDLLPGKTALPPGGRRDRMGEPLKGLKRKEETLGFAEDLFPV